MPEPVPQKVTRGTPFVLDNPVRPANPAKLDTELNAVVQSLNAVIDFVRQPIADDGTIRPDAVGLSTNRFTFTQASAASVWTVNHNLGFNPTVHVYSVGGVEVEAQITHTSLNQTVINFATPYAGYAICH